MSEDKNNSKVKPLHLKSMGSFNVGGLKRKLPRDEELKVTLTHGGEPLKFNLRQTFHSGSMYVQYFVPLNERGRCPLLLWHGGGLTGACFEDTPDGRPGWLNYFIQKGWTVFNSDAVERGRSGWMPYDEPFTDMPFYFPEYFPFELWRLGNGRYKEMDWSFYNDSQFPIEYYDELLKRLVPSWANSYPLTLQAYKELVDREDESVILGHSQGASFAFRIAELIPEKVKAIVAIEPGAGGDLENAKRLKNIPILSVYGDYIKNSDRWTKICAKTKDYYDEIRKNGGKVDSIFLPDIGYNGNSHLLMIEKNNKEIGDYINNWLKEQGLYN